MAITFAEPLGEARALLNDVDGAIYEDAPMIKLGNKVYRELQTKCSALGIGTAKEATSSPVDVDAGTVVLSDGAGLPTDLLYPIMLYERTQDSEEFWKEMTEKNWEPVNWIAQPTLVYWAWREEQIHFAESTGDREVLIKYMKSLGSITATSSAIAILNSTGWIAQRLAAVASLVIGSNPSRAQALNTDLVQLWDDLRITLVRRKQTVPVRRRRTRYRRP